MEADPVEPVVTVDQAMRRLGCAAVDRAVALLSVGSEPAVVEVAEAALAEARNAFHLALADQEGSALAGLAERVGLGLVETELFAVLLVAEQDEAVQRLLVSLTAERDRHRVEVWMLGALLGAGAWAVAPAAPLVSAALVETVSGFGAFGRTQLRIPPRLLWALAGDPSPDPALDTRITSLSAPVHGAAVDVLVVGSDRVRRQQAAISSMGSPLALVSTAPGSDAAWAALVREAGIAGAAVVIETEGSIDLLGRRWIERAGHLRWALSSETRLPLDDLPRRGWREVAAGEDAPGAAEWAFVLGTEVEQRHHLTAAQLETMGKAMAVTGGDPGAAYRRLTDAKLDKLATQIVPRAGWDDLVLSPVRKSRLRDLIDRYEQAERVYDDWKFPATPSRGVVALFSGPSGTGKTLSAEVVAGALGLDLYRLDISSVVSKYIGETEKNLDGLFDAAAIGNTVLFFDEADALFGKRTEVKDSHDRYANVETSYLLQRLERYDGVVVLCTNYEKNIDQAFLRRVHVRLDFAMPSENERAELWRRNLASGAPLADDLDLDFLVRGFDLSGAGIRNAVIDAAFLAAAAGRPIGMEHLVRAVARELQKLGRMVNENQFGRWYSAALASTDPRVTGQ